MDHPNWIIPETSFKKYDFQWATRQQPPRKAISNEKLGIEYEVNGNDIILTYENPAQYLKHSELIPVTYTKGTATVLPDGMEVCLDRLDIDLGRPQSSLAYAFSDGVMQRIASRDIFQKNEAFSLGLKLSFKGTAPFEILETSDLFEQSTLLCIQDDLMISDDRKSIYGNLPLSPQFPLLLQVLIAYGGEEKVSVPAHAGSFVTTDGITMRYCGEIVADADTFHYIEFESTPSLELHSSFGFGDKKYRIFTFIHDIAIKAGWIANMVAVCTDGTHKKLDFLMHDQSSAGHTFAYVPLSQEKIDHFEISFPKHLARVVCTIPRIHEVWSEQKVKNRFDLKIPPLIAEALNESKGSRFLWEGLPGALGLDLRMANSRYWSNAKGIDDYREKPLWEILVEDMRLHGESPTRYVLEADRYIFRPKTSIGHDLRVWLDEKGISEWLWKKGWGEWMDRWGIKEDGY